MVRLERSHACPRTRGWSSTRVRVRPGAAAPAWQREEVGTSFAKMHVKKRVRSSCGAALLPPGHSATARRVPSTARRHPATSEGYLQNVLAACARTTQAQRWAIDTEQKKQAKILNNRHCWTHLYSSLTAVLFPRPLHPQTDVQDPLLEYAQQRSENDSGRKGDREAWAGAERRSGRIKRRRRPVPLHARENTQEGTHHRAAHSSRKHNGTHRSASGRSLPSTQPPTVTTPSSPAERTAACRS